MAARCGPQSFAFINRFSSRLHAAETAGGNLLSALERFAE